jgi:hypothetical protein
MLIDLQVHTTLGSPDSVIDPGEIVQRCRDAGIDGVALTEHRTWNPAGAAEEFGAAGVVVLPARELTCAGAHVLFFTTDLDLLTTLPLAVGPGDPVWRRDDVATVWAHPAAVGGSSAYPVFPPSPPDGMAQWCRGVELLNGRHLHFEQAVSAAAQTAAALGLPTTGGSDAHRPADIGRCATHIETEGRDAASIVAAMRAGKMRPVLTAAWAEKHGYDYRQDLARFLE